MTRIERILENSGQLDNNEVQVVVHAVRHLLQDALAILAKYPDDAGDCEGPCQVELDSYRLVELLGDADEYDDYMDHLANLASDFGERSNSNMWSKEVRLTDARPDR